MDKNTPISELRLDTKPYKALMALGVETIGDFLPLPLDRVLEIRGMGDRTLKRLSVIRRRIQASLDRLSEGSNDHELDWNTTFDQLSVRTQHGLAELGIDTLNAFLALTQEEFLSVRAIGVTSWNEVHQHQNRLHNVVASITNASLADTASHTTSSALSGHDPKESLLAVRNALGTRQHILDDLCIRSFSQLLTISYEEVTALKHVGQVTWKILQEAIHKASAIAEAHGNVRSLEEIKITDFPLFDGDGIGSAPIPGFFYPDTLTDSLALSPRSITVLKNLRLNSLKAVLMTYPERLLSRSNFGEKSLVTLRQSILDYLKYRNNSEGSSADTGKSFPDFLRTICRLSGQPKKRTDILLGRLGGISGEIKTYEALALKHGYTRERIRQILKKTLGSIEQHFQSRVTLNSFRSTARHILDDCRGIISLSDLGKQLSDRLQWKRRVPAESLRELFKSFSFGNGIAIRDDKAMCKHPCRTCRMVVERAHELMNSSESGILSFGNFSEPSDLCKPSPDIGCPSNCGVKYSRSFLYELAGRANFYYDDDNAYSSSAWVLLCGSIPKKTEVVLEMLGKAATPEEVWEAMCPYLDEFIPLEKIHSILIQADGAYVWGRGEYIHKNHIHVHRDILPLIRDSLLARLANAPFVALHGVFQELRVPCEKARIPNDYALSTVVSLYLDDFHVDRYRYVYVDKPSEATSIDTYIEQWILKQGSEVKRSDLEQWMVEHIGVRKSLVQQSLGRLSDVFASRRGYLIHIDNTGMDSETLAPFYRQAKDALEQHDHIGVGRLFKNQQVTCYQLGIVSKSMLYAAMRHFYSDVLEFTHYPHICRQNQDSFDTLGESVSEYIRERNSVVAVDDCVQQFEAKGYSPTQLRARLSNLSRILPFYPGCVVHADTIGWDTDKASQLRDVLFEAYVSRLDLGHLVGDLEEVYDLYEKQLPVLSADMSWTHDLLAALAAKCDDVVLIGNARRAYAITVREDAITTLADLVVVVVRDHFGGGCSREQMNQWMQDNGVVRKQLTTHMFATPPGLEMSDYECLWKGGSDA